MTDDDDVSARVAATEAALDACERGGREVYPDDGDGHGDPLLFGLTLVGVLLLGLLALLGLFIAWRLR